MKLAEAKDIALGVWNELKPHCDICKIAGSIRREKPEVGDIELVALPRTETGKDLFGGDAQTFRVPAWKEAVMGLGKVLKGASSGKYMQIELTGKGIDLDLFMPDDFDYYRQFCVRTGSAEWVMKNVASGWKAIGWCGSDAGLRMISQCEPTKGPDGKTKWKCIVPQSEQILPPHWKSEEDFFSWLKLKWVEPKYRNI
jgi:DNA polymerase/3'-5' exonuclease PolX